MPLPTIAGTVRAAVTGKLPSGQKWVNVHHWRYSGGASNPGTTEVTALDALLVRLYKGAQFGSGVPWLNICAAAVTCDEIDYLLLDGTSNGWTFLKSGLVGSGGSSIPSECAPCMTLKTGKRGRKNTGRIFLPAVSQTYVGANGNLSGGTASAFVAQYAGLITAAASALWVPVVASYGKTVHKNGSVTTWTPYATDIVGGVMDDFVDVQRRRKK